MAGGRIRFLHAADLRLDRPVDGLEEAPEHLVERLIDAPLEAARNLFDTAISEHVDFVLLAGDVLDPSLAGARGVAFLVEQFERLAEQDIAVYWAGGQVDPPDAWPAAVRLPEGVHRFPRGAVEEVIHFRDDDRHVAILGISRDDRELRAAEFRSEDNRHFTVAMAHGEINKDEAAKARVHYWALGGRPRRETVLSTPRTIQYCGAHQARTADQTGAHGCTLATVERNGAIRTQHVALDAVRWVNETIKAPKTGGKPALHKILAERLQAHAAAGGGRTMLVNFAIQGVDKMQQVARQRRLAKELLKQLRNEFGHQSPAVWTASIEVEANVPLPEKLVEEDTILGDFVRAVKQAEEEKDKPLDLSPYSSGEAAAALTGQVMVRDAGQRRKLLREAALMGLDLLSGDEGSSAK